MFPVTRQVRRKRTRVSGRRERTRGEHATAPGNMGVHARSAEAPRRSWRGEPGSTHIKGGLGGNVRGGLGGNHGRAWGEQG